MFNATFKQVFGISNDKRFICVCFLNMVTLGSAIMLSTCSSDLSMSPPAITMYKCMLTMKPAPVPRSSGGWPGLLQEIELEVTRISARNLGRDDRYMHCGHAQLSILY